MSGVQERFISYLPVREALAPVNGAQVIADSWWMVHPSKGLVFYRKYSPQCNIDSRISKKLAWMYPDCEVAFFPVVFVPIRHQPPGGY